MHEQLGNECDGSLAIDFQIGDFDGAAHGCSRRGSISDDYQGQEIVAVASETDVRMCI